ncbi:MAG: diacylglycerol kinase family protein [Gammaproteobacteria bacterium]|nr:diacylglycerol kinase [Gammaproteobacteria bacterium]
MRIPAITDRTPYYIVLNVRSGAGSAVECRAQMQDILQKAGRAHQFFLVEHAQQLAPILASAVHAACENRGALVGGGGDGTINAAAHSVLEMGLPFGVVPQGTFNYLSRTYSIPSEVQDATLALLRARVRPIQVGVLNDRIFLVNASLGLHPHLLQERDAFARQFGRRRTVALWAGLITLMKGYRQLVLEIEHENGHEEVVRTPTLVIGNNPLQLEQIGISEAEEVQHGQLAAIIVRPVGARTLLWLALRGALGRLGADENVRSFALRHLIVRIKGADKVKVAIDGEILWLSSPLRFSISPQRLMLMVPEIVRSA